MCLGRSSTFLNLTHCIHCIFWGGLEGAQLSTKAVQCHCSHASASLCPAGLCPVTVLAPARTLARFTSGSTAKSTEFWSHGWALDEEQNHVSALGMLTIQTNKIIIKIKKSSHKPVFSVLSRKPNAVAAAVNPFPALPVRNGLVQLTLH